MLEKQTYVRDMSPGIRIDDHFFLAEASLGQARNGPFWKLTLQDASGRVDAKIWSPASRDYDGLASGMFVRARGMVESFRDQPQVNVESLGVVDPGDVDLVHFVPAGEHSPEDLFQRLEMLLKEHLKFKPWLKFCRKVLDDEKIRSSFINAPGAKTVHHAYLGGLLEHTLAVAELCMDTCDRYPQLDRQLLLTAAAFHDLGKAWELTPGPVFDYTDQGRLLGHIVIGLDKLRPFLARAKDLDENLKLQLEHVILSHHGEYEYGSPRLPMTAEALVLHHMDNLDAKLCIVRNACAGLDGEVSGWTDYNRFLNRQLFQAPATPGEGGNRPSDAERKKREGQCLLPLKE